MIHPPRLLCRRLPSRSRLRPPHACLSLRAGNRRRDDRGVPGPVIDIPTPPIPPPGSSAWASTSAASSSAPPTSSSLPPNLGSSAHPFADPDPAREPRIEVPNEGTDIGRDQGIDRSDTPLEGDSEPSGPSLRSARLGPSSNPVDGDAQDALDASATAVARVPLPEPLVLTPKRVRQPFDTHRFVSKLEEATVPPDVARTLMESVRGLITHRVERATSSMLSKEELDKEAYLWKAALSKLRTEFNVRNRNAGIAGRNALSAIRRDLDSVELKMSEDVQTLKHDIELDMGNRKTDQRSEMKQTSITIEEISNRATISIGDLKTEIESAKWEATRRAIAIIVVLVVFGVGMSTVTFGETPAAETPAPAPAPPPPVMRDIGVGPDEDPFDYEARIDKLLSSVERPERRERPRRHSKPEPYVDRI